MAFWLTQKYCSCPGDPIPGCCPSGWQTVFVGSRFCKQSESNYHPIEGEAAASAWALSKCRMFVLGHPNLLLAVDHKPLLAIFGPNQELGEIDNPRLLNFKMKTMQFRFKPIFIPGKKHVVPDTLSRRNDSPIAQLPPRQRLPPTVNNVKPQYSEDLGPPSWVSGPSVAATLANIGVPINQEDPAHDDMEDIMVGLAYSNLATINTKDKATVALYSADKIQVITWDRLETAARQCPVYKQLHQMIHQGVSDNSNDWGTDIKPFFQCRQGFSTHGPVVLLYDRPVIPASLRKEVMEHLHAAHGCSNGMFQRASNTLYWPSYRQDINSFQSSCATCRRIAPSNPALPPSDPPEMPQYPFQSICADFFTHAAKNYLTIVDRYSHWLSVFQLEKDDSRHLIKALRDYFTHFGICSTLSSDGASIFTSAEMTDFCRRWGVQQRISSSYFPTSNKRAEVGVKSSKRLIQDNIKPNGDLDTEKFSRALLIHRNTPDPSTNMSPAMIVFGRQLRDHIPAPIGDFHPRKEWQELHRKREEAFCHRHVKLMEDKSRHTSKLKQLSPQDKVYIQDQKGRTPRRWNRTGVVLELLPHNSVLVKVDGSGKITKRNRQFLRYYEPFSIEPNQPQPLPSQQIRDTDVHSQIISQESPQQGTQYSDHHLVDDKVPDDRAADDQLSDDQASDEQDQQVTHPQPQVRVTHKENDHADPTPQLDPPVNNPTSVRRKDLPKHLREYWIVNPALQPQPKPDTVSQIKYTPSQMPNHPIIPYQYPAPLSVIPWTAMQSPTIGACHTPVGPYMPNNYPFMPVTPNWSPNPPYHWTHQSPQNTASAGPA